MFRRFFILTPVLGSSLLFSSCMLTEMHEATTSMPGKMDNMTKITCTMYRSMRQGNSKLSRDQDFNDIEEASNLSGKLAEAAEYMQGFEFQVWTTDCAPELPRDEVIEQSVKELLAKVQGFIFDREAVNPGNLMNQVFRADKIETLFALAATLHYTNSLQKNFMSGTPYEVLSPFSILVKGLEIDAKKNNGQMEKAMTPAYAEVVGKYSKEAIYLLRLRQNFLMAYAYALVDSDEFGNTPGSFKKLIRMAAKKKAWKPKLENRTASEIETRITQALLYAVETNEALVRLGIDPMVDSTFAQIWANADFSKYDLPTKIESENPSDRIFAEAVLSLSAARDRMVTAWKTSIEN